MYEYQYEQFFFMRKRRPVTVRREETNCIAKFGALVNKVMLCGRVLDEVHDYMVRFLWTKNRSYIYYAYSTVEKHKNLGNELLKAYDDMYKSCSRLRTRPYISLPFTISRRDVEALVFALNYVSDLLEKLVKRAVEESEALTVADVSEDYIVRINDILGEAIMMLLGASRE